MDPPQDQPIDGAAEPVVDAVSDPATEFPEIATVGEAGLGDGPPRFENEPVHDADLPRLADQAFQPLDPAYLRVRRIGSLIFAAVLLIAAVVIAVGVPIPVWIPVLGAVAVVILTAIGLWLQRLEVDNLGYLVRDKDFSFRRGVIQRSVATVPFARVQHVSIQRGPLERWAGLATLEMKTAGDDIHVPGMSAETASRLKDLVVDRAGSVADEEAELR